MEDTPRSPRMLRLDVDVVTEPRTRTRSRSLLVQDVVTMTVLAQDPSVVDDRGLPVLARIPVPAGRLARGPCTHRFRVEVPGSEEEPLLLHGADAWDYQDAWAAYDGSDDPGSAGLLGDRAFRAQHLLAVAAHTLALVERHLGRPVPWQSGLPQLVLRRGRHVAAAHYDRGAAGVDFGWTSAFDDRPSTDTALSFDVVAHEVTHAVLDGLRPRYAEPGPPDQLAFHEALADLVAMLSVFAVEGAPRRLLDTDGDGRVALDATDPARVADELRATPLHRLAEQLGRTRPDPQGRPAPALRSFDLPRDPSWRDDPAFLAPHRRAEVLVAAVLDALTSMWAGRLRDLRDEGGLDAERVAEEGSKCAEHLLGMLLRALDYLPPVELEYDDVLTAVLVADARLAPDDRRGYRDSLRAAFAAYGIEPTPERVLDEDEVAGRVAGRVSGRVSGRRARRRTAQADPDGVSDLGLRYEHLNRAAMRTSPEQIHQFVWNNAALLDVDVRLPTRVERVVASTRVGPDGLVVEEVAADYTQRLETTAGALPGRITAPRGTPPDTPVVLRGGGVLVFDQFGRFRLHLRKPLLDVERQKAMLRRPAGAATGTFGVDDEGGARRRLAALHPDRSEDAESGAPGGGEADGEHHEG